MVAALRQLELGAVGDEFILDRGEFAESALSASVVGGAFDPGDDVDAEII